MKCARRHSFSNSKIKVTALYSVKSGADLAPQLQDLDSVIVGSDQVWNLGLTGEDFQYFLPGSAEDKEKFVCRKFRKVKRFRRQIRLLNALGTSNMLASERLMVSR